MGKGALGQLAAYWPEDTARYAHVPLKRVGEVTLHAAAATAADRPALVSRSGVASYGELSARVKRAAEALRGRVAKGARVALALDDPVELVTALFACFENELLAFASAPVNPAALALFAPDLVLGAAAVAGRPAVAFADLLVEEGKKATERPDFKKPLLALPLPDGSGEALHNHKTLAATAIAVGSFFMMDGETRVWLEEAPAGWLGLSLLLGCFQKGATVFAAWGEAAPPIPDRVDYLVVGWPAAMARFVDSPPRIPRLKIGAGAIVGVEGGFSVSRRRRLSRRLAAPILTLLGRNDLGPVIASHPTWFLDDAVGIPLPNVDTRPMNPANGEPLSIGWDAVESAEIGFKSALAPAGGELMAEGWLRSRWLSEIDPTGLYFLGGAGAH